MAQVRFEVMNQELGQSQSHQNSNFLEQNRKAHQFLQNQRQLESENIEQHNQQQRQQEEQPPMIIFEPVEDIRRNYLEPVSVQQILEQLIRSSQLQNQIFCFRYLKILTEPIYLLLIFALVYNNQQVPFCQCIWAFWYLLFGCWRFFKIGFHTFVIDFINYYLWMIYFFGFDDHSLSSQFRIEKFMFLLINIDYFATWPTYIFIAFKFFKSSVPQIIYLRQKNRRKLNFLKSIKKLKRNNNIKLEQKTEQSKQNSKNLEKSTNQQQNSKKLEQRNDQGATVSTNKESEQDICAICLSADPTDLLPCKHCYHQQCIQQWLKQHNNCPICRVQFF